MIEYLLQLYYSVIWIVCQGIKKFLYSLIN